MTTLDSARAVASKCTCRARSFRVNFNRAPTLRHAGFAESMTASGSRTPKASSGSEPLTRQPPEHLARIRFGFNYVLSAGLSSTQPSKMRFGTRPWPSCELHCSSRSAPRLRLLSSRISRERPWPLDANVALKNGRRFGVCESTGRLRLGEVLDMAKHPQVDPVDEGFGPDSPVGLRRHVELVPRAPLETRSSAG